MLTNAFNLSAGAAHVHPGLHSQILLKNTKNKNVSLLKRLYIYVCVHICVFYIYIYANKSKKEQSGDKDINLPNYPPI